MSRAGEKRVVTGELRENWPLRLIMYMSSYVESDLDDDYNLWKSFVLSFLYFSNI